MIILKNYCPVLIPLLCGLKFLSAQSLPLPTSESSLFTGSANCNNCHVSGGGVNVLKDSLGNDLTPAKFWRSTMMANSAKDPYWQAKVEAEVNENPHLKSQIEDKCTTCHIPMGRTQAVWDGEEYYALDDAIGNPLAMDGVSCTVCHQIQPDNFGMPSSFSGGYIIDSSRVIYGPYEDIEGDIMTSGILFEPRYGPHMLQAELCATCHTLYTNYVDDNGEVAGVFPEQMPYWEWKASQYPAMEISCQTCHVPAINEEIIISSLPQSGLTAKSPFYKHHFVGGNTFMLTLLKNNAMAIGVTASAEHFDSTIALTRRQLQNKTIDLSVNTTQENNNLFIDVNLQNKTGHKFPTGYPARRAWIHLTVVNATGDTLFESGAFNSNGEIISQGESYFSHFDTINHYSDVQVYEAVMGDVNSNETKTLLRAASYLKDNRIPPIGFSGSAENYEDIAVRGLAEYDLNFNESSGGSDKVTYVVNVRGQNSGNFTIYTEIIYQSINPGDIDHLRQHETDKVQTFLGYYDNETKIPEIIKTATHEMAVIVGLTEEIEIPQSIQILQNYPNPFNNSTTIKYFLNTNESSVELLIFNLQGKKVKTLKSDMGIKGEHTVQWNSTDDNNHIVSSGIYLLHLKTSQQQLSKKIILIK
jgi:hypothetical protein